MASTTGNALGTNCGSAYQTTFNTCVANALYLPSGSYAASITDFCASYQSGPQGPWYVCLCNETRKIQACYENTCPNDATYSSIQSEVTQYCDAAALYVSTSTAAAAAATAATAAAAETVSAASAATVAVSATSTTSTKTSGASLTAA
ncbi:hypothetical protein HDU84_009426, partial [Entophlyctis sp. JEL0112]